jgi:hypothetical protein
MIGGVILRTGDGFHRRHLAYVSVITIAQAVECRFQKKASSFQDLPALAPPRGLTFAQQIAAL